MHDRIASQIKQNRVFRSNAPSIRNCMFLIAAMAPLYASTLCLAAGQAETAPGQTGVTARYLGALESDSTMAAVLPAPGLAGPLAVTATTPAPAILSFNPAAIGVAAGSAQKLTASFSVSGYSGSFTPTATLHYDYDYTIGAMTCTPSGASETCNVPVTFRPSLPGARKDAIFLMDGTTRLATVLLSGVGQGPLSLVQPGAFSTSVPTTNYIYQSVADENGVVYILPNGNTPYIERVTKAGVATQIPLTAPPYFWTIGIDGAGVLYLFNETSTVTTYDTVQGIQGTYQIPSEPLGTDPTQEWFPGALGVDGSIYVVNQIRNNGVAYALKPDGTTGYAVTFNPGVLQPFTAAVDSAGDFFVGGYEINKITPSGTQTQVNTVGASEGLAVDAADTLYATRYSPTDGVAELPASDYSTPIASFGRSSPLGMSLGSDGTLYVSNYVNLDIFDRSTTETVDFGEVNAGSSQTNSTASVYNGGNQPLTISGFTLSTLSDTGFSLDSSSANECTFGIVLAPGALCQASVVFAPTHPGTFTGTIVITSNSLNGASTAQTIQLSGTTYGSYDVLSPSPLVFAAQALGTSKTLAVTLTNEGNYYASTIYSVATDNPAFTIAQGTCSGVAVQVGASCQLQVTFTPSATQAYTGTATVVTYVSGSGQPFQTITLPLSGTSSNPPAATPVITPGTGSYTTSQQVTITDATAGATIYYTADGSAPSSASTKYSGAITVSSDETLKAIATAAGLSQSATASATYTFQEPVATVTPTSLAFGNQVLNQASAAQTVTVKNTGIGALTLTGFPISGSADFSQTNNCPGSLAAGGSCTVSVLYTPKSHGAEAATLTVNSSSIQPAPSVALTGTGIVQPPVLTISPATLNFGNQVINTSATLQATVTNISKTDTILLGGVFTTSSLTLTASGASCSSPLAPGTSCTVSVTFTPSAIQAFNGTVTLQPQPSGCGGCTRNYPAQTIAVTGAGIAQPPVLSFSPASLAFGNQIVNTLSSIQTFTVTNTSATDTITLPTFLTTSSPALSGTDVGCSSLAPGAKCTASINFLPTAVQTYTMNVLLQPEPTNCGGCVRNYPPQTFPVTGAGIAQPPVLTFSPRSLNFGNQVVNTDAPLNVTVTNISTTDTVFVGDVFTTSSIAFTAYGASCMSPLAPGKSCKVQVTFSPSKLQAYSETVTFQPQPSGCGGCTRNYPVQTLAVTGTGINPPPPVFTPASLAFGSQAVGSASASQTVTLTNPASSLPIAINSFVFGSTLSFEQTNNCPATLAAGASCQIQVVFAPRGTGALSDNLRLNYVIQGGPAYALAALTGTGINPPQPTFTPGSLSFGNQVVGSASAPQSVTLTNPASADQPITINSFIYASNSKSFKQTNNCPATLASGASCQIEISFAPNSAGAISDSLLLNYVEGGQPNFILANLNGTGVAPLASLTPASMSFTATTGTTSAPQTATLSNTGKAQLDIFSISITGASPNDYRQTSNCGSFLAVGASCAISVTFSPAFAGNYPATLTVSDNAQDSQQTASLSGAGSVTPDFVIASSTPAQVILPGGSAQFSLTVTAQHGASIPAVNLSATGLPPGATATFSHSAVTPGSTSATSTLTIKTSTKSAAVASSAWPLSAPALAVVGLFFIPATRRRRWASLAVLMIVSLGALTALSGCGGSTLPPAKSYNVTVIGTIGAVQQTTSVQLTVK